MPRLTRRSFLTAAAGAAAAPAFLADFHRLRAADLGKVKITDIKTMMLQGPRSYTLVRVETDAGVYGNAEAYGSPGIGVREESLPSHIWSGVTSPWKMLPPIRPTRDSMSGGPRTSWAVTQSP